MYMIQKSFEYKLKNNPNLNLYIYSDTSINTDQVYTCKSKTDLTATDTTFVLQYEFGGIYIDFISEDKDYLKYRYIQYTDSDDNIKYIQIVEYDNTTGQVTISEGFGEDVSTDKTFSVIVLDSLFINLDNPTTVGGQRRFSQENVLVEMKLQTKQDSKKKKIYNFIDSIKTSINSQTWIPVYSDETYSIIDFYSRPTRPVRFNETLNSGSQYIEYFGTTNLEYYNEY